jgi:kinetochore protein Nuf2
MVFEWFAELLMNTTRETVEPAMHAAAEDLCGDYPDIVPNDTRNLMGFFIMLRKLLAEVLITISTPQKIYRLTHFMTASAVSTTSLLQI